MSELEPCPFCFGEGYTVCREREKPYDDDWFVECHDCGAKSGTYPVKEYAIEAWNTRCERTSAVEWRVVNEQEEIVCGYCQCGKWLDIRHTWEAPRLPRYCSDCGAKVVDDGD